MKKIFGSLVLIFVLTNQPPIDTQAGTSGENLKPEIKAKAAACKATQEIMSPVDSLKRVVRQYDSLMADIGSDIEVIKVQQRRILNN